MTAASRRGDENLRKRDLIAEISEIGAPSCFREAFCRRFDVAPELYELAMLERCLSRRARLLAPVIRGLSRHYFSVDQLFIQSIGRARTRHELRTELKAFREHSVNREWLRRRLKLRLSIWRVLDVADEVLPHLPRRAPLAAADGDVLRN